MSIKVGATKNDYKKNESTPFVETGRFSERGTYQHRVIAGPFRKETIIYPSYYTDTETNILELGYNAIVVPTDSRNTVLDKVRKIDRGIQKNKGVDKDKVRSQLDRSVRYVYIVISRDLSTPDNVWIGPWEYNATLHKELRETQEKMDRKDSSLLMYGPWWTYDVILEKYIDEESLKKTHNEAWSTRYRLDVDFDTLQHGGKIPKEILEDESFCERNAAKIDSLKKSVFTPEEIAAINVYLENHDIIDFVSPIKSDEEIFDILKEKPINFGATDKNGDLVFKYKEDIKEELETIGENLLLTTYSSADSKFKQLKGETVLEEKEVKEAPKEAEVMQTEEKEKTIPYDNTDEDDAW